MVNFLLLLHGFPPAQPPIRWYHPSIPLLRWGLASAASTPRSQSAPLGGYHMASAVGGSWGGSSFGGSLVRWLITDINGSVSRNILSMFIGIGIVNILIGII